MPNGLKTALLLGILSALLLGLGEMLGGAGGLATAFVFAAIMNMGSYWFSDKIVLRMYRAAEVGPSHQLYKIVERLTARAGLPMPKVYVIPDPSPNAFATGRNPAHAAVSVTKGILQILDERELRGVLAHELSHVANHDILIGSIASGIGMSITFLARFAMFFGGGDSRNNPLGAFGALFAWILAPLAAAIIQMAVSRSREYQADESGAFLSHDPQALAGALRKLELATRQVPPPASVGPAQANLFIVNPFGSRRSSGASSLAQLFSTHPPTEARIARLHEIQKTLP